VSLGKRTMGTSLGHTGGRESSSARSPCGPGGAHASAARAAFLRACFHVIMVALVFTLVHELPLPVRRGPGRRAVVRVAACA